MESDNWTFGRCTDRRQLWEEGIICRSSDVDASSTSSNPAIAAEQEQPVQALQATAASAEHVAQLKLATAAQGVGQAVSAGNSAGIPIARVLLTLGVVTSGSFIAGIFANEIMGAISAGAEVSWLEGAGGVAATGPLGLVFAGVGMTIWAIWKA